MAEASVIPVELLAADRSKFAALQLDKLPFELLVEIFSYLGNRKDLVSCCKVSKSFYAASISPSLWKSLCSKVWRIFKEHNDNWKSCYAEMYLGWGRYEECYADIRKAWDLIENYAQEYCPRLLEELNPGVNENKLNEVEIRNLNGRVLPDDYRCFLRIHDGQEIFFRSGVLGVTSIANHCKREALLNVAVATSGIIQDSPEGLHGCIPIALCLETKCGHYLAITEEAGHKLGRVLWPSVDNETLTSSGYLIVNSFVIADSFTQWFTTHAERMVKEQYPVVNDEIYPYMFASEDTGTNGITVKTATCFLPELSKINPPKFFFTYRISISMDPSFAKKESCKLETRHWYITDGNGEKEEVHGFAVVGEYPTITPGAKHEYVSCTSFSTPTGTMEGYYTFNYLYKEGGTNARVAPMHFKAPPFELESEREKRRTFRETHSDSESD